MANKKRLIDADALMKSIRSFRWFGPPNTLKLMFEYLWLIIRDEPTVEAVEVVHCKDCRYYEVEPDDHLGVCNCGSIAMNNKGEMYPERDHFCACGERKDND